MCAHMYVMLCAHVRDVASVVPCYSRRGLHAGVRGVESSGVGAFMSYTFTVFTS